jgi:hypothetical protein
MQLPVATLSAPSPDPTSSAAFLMQQRSFTGFTGFSQGLTGQERKWELHCISLTAVVTEWNVCVCLSLHAKGWREM